MYFLYCNKLNGIWNIDAFFKTKNILIILKSLLLFTFIHFVVSKKNWNSK